MDTEQLLHQAGHDFHAFDNADAAVARITELYDHAAGLIRHAFATRDTSGLADAVYPYLAFTPAAPLPADGPRPPFDVVLEPGFYGTTLTRPALFGAYWYEQIASLLHHYRTPVMVGLSRQPIPLSYVMEEAVTSLTESDLAWIQTHFALPDLHVTDDSIANCEYIPRPDVPRPLALFTAQRTDYSLARLHHYTGTAPRHFQRFILLTNYQRYVDAFREYGHAQVDAGSEYTSFVEPGEIIHTRESPHAATHAGQSLPQMPAYHLCRPDGDGITLINIGVGPANAKTITDHLAVLRPHCWLMVGHCAGLRRSQKLGDYVLAHGYLRDDHVLDDDLPPWVPVPPIAEVQMALQDVTARVTGLHDAEVKTRLRTGTVMTTDNRNWELRLGALFTRINTSRAIAVDMESATIAANGFRFRVPYGTLLCVSDKPLHGELKLRGMANAFYRERVRQHLVVGIETMQQLRAQGVDRLHSRKLRGFDEPAFR
ncbi:AMP nucleosidase [Komagataeibacter nataicola]|uniref:AMP nucleosidase n=1 Tax=Komagataeibacter nataicola TaxID=265960 RepID=A0A9N7CDB6_9PROT|nr:AMP nucleosidase [Komagataeibacter nataicola]AQU87429.1 AMP nucleosidase [Komagataeibacter nataicola]PYD65374.1 AMP nucleosidase [Komagataeibacter nataicola]WEQ55165.1 AMP nucleosidase [Komagataeibacter nataicola]WNM09944.1 AMP nucleosidase [Komagataeibacter nataicola]GBR24822.1 AMP nucleosidase [Komagataeibacter nataicola NRIC 0616]